MPGGLVALVALVALAAACQPAARPAPTDPRATAPLPTPSAAGAASGSDGASGAAGSTGGTLRWAITEPMGITPATATSPDALLIVDALFDSLTRVDQQGHVQPAAAWGWRAEPDAATWIFRLRSGAQWHDGTPVTAQDFVDGWSLAVRKGLTAFHLADVDGYVDVRSGATSRLAGVTALDAHTLQVRLVRPRADFPVVVGHPSLGPVHPAAVAAADSAAAEHDAAERGDPGATATTGPGEVDADRHPLGNGPFRMAEAWVREQFVRVVPAEGWRNQRTGPHVAEVLFRSLDPDAAYVAFQQGRVDIADVPPGALQQALETYGEAAEGYAGPGVLRGDAPVLYHLAFDVSQPPFDDPEVRRAVSLAIDRTALSRAVLQGNVRPARGIIPPAIPGSRRLACSACRHAPDEAREIFSARGITQLTLWFNPDGGHGQVAREVRSQLAEAGVAVGFEAPDSTTFAAAVRNGSAGWFRAGWAAEHLTPEDAMVPLLRTGGVGNLGGYSAPDVDALFDAAAAELDEERRIALLQQAEDLVLDRDQAIVPLFTYRLDLVVSERLENFRVDPLGRVDLSTVRLHPTPPQTGP